MNRQIEVADIADVPMKPRKRLVRYVLAAILARMATGGATVALLVLARSYHTEGTQLGLLVACLTAPHVFGPVYGRWLDKARNPRYLITAAAFLFPLFFQLAIIGFEQDLLWLITAALLVCGACTSFLMGGLSTQLPSLVQNELGARRSAQSWDAVTYGLGLTFGPMIIAAMSALYGVHIAIALLISLPVFAGLLILGFPVTAGSGVSKQETVPGFSEVLGIIYHSPPLKRTMLMTSGAACSVAVLPVMAVYLGELWLQNMESGAWLITAYGVGSLCGAILLILKPLKADAVLLLRNVGGALLLTLIMIALSQSFTAGIASYWLCGLVNGIFFAATLAARTEHAPQQGSAQVYLWVAAAKISAASIGAFAAGYVVTLAIYLPFVFSSIILAAMLMLCFWRRKRRGALGEYHTDNIKEN